MGDAMPGTLPSTGEPLPRLAIPTVRRTRVAGQRSANGTRSCGTVQRLMPGFAERHSVACEIQRRSCAEFAALFRAADDLPGLDSTHGKHIRIRQSSDPS